MFDFLEVAEGATKVYGYIGVFGTATFIIINLLMLVGFLDEFGIDIDWDLDALESAFTPFKLVTFRGIIAFIMFFGWGGYFFESIIYASLLGLIAFISIGLVYYFSRKLQQKGNYSLQNSIGREGTVYLKIKEGKASKGKVLIKLSSGLKELDAISEESLEYDDRIVVIDVLENILIVKKIEEEN